MDNTSSSLTPNFSETEYELQCICHSSPRPPRNLGKERVTSQTQELVTRWTSDLVLSPPYPGSSEHHTVGTRVDPSLVIESKDPTCGYNKWYYCAPNEMEVPRDPGARADPSSLELKNGGKGGSLPPYFCRTITESTSPSVEKVSGEP